MPGELWYYDADAIDSAGLTQEFFGHFVYRKELPGHPKWHRGMRFYTAYKDDYHCLCWSKKKELLDILNKYRVEIRRVAHNRKGFHLDADPIWNKLNNY